jgi:hypothetical protein
MVNAHSSLAAFKLNQTLVRRGGSKNQTSGMSLIIASQILCPSN